MDKLRVAVIGSGFGGLSAAIRLQAAGFQVKIFEKRDMPGGRAYVYKDQGFTFDAGPTVITAPECLEELFTVSGKKMSDYVEMMPVTPFYRLLWEDGYKFDYCQSVEKTLEQIRAKSPEDADGYLRFLDYTKEVYDEGYTKLAAKPFLNWWSMIRVSPQLMRLGAWKSVYKVVSQYVRDPQLREAFSFHTLLVGGNPFSTSSIYTLIHYLERSWGVHFPKGGTGALVQALVKVFKENGGEIECNAEVSGIQTLGNQVTGVKFKNATPWKCQAVVSNADVVHTYKNLMSHHPRANEMARKLENMHHSMSLVVIYFGTKKRYPELAHHNIIFGPRYKELLKDIFKRGILPDDFSLYLHAPTISDPSLAPEGGEAFYVLSPVANMEKLKIDWDTEGPIYAGKILDYLEQHHLPDLKANIVTQRIFTPKDFKTELNAHVGAAFSLEPLLTQSAFFRTHNRDEHIQNLYIVGAGTHPGAGLPGVVNSGKATAGLICEDFADELVKTSARAQTRSQARSQGARATLTRRTTPTSPPVHQSVSSPVHPSVSTTMQTPMPERYSDHGSDHGLGQGSDHGLGQGSDHGSDQGSDQGSGHSSDHASDHGSGQGPNAEL